MNNQERYRSLPLLKVVLLVSILCIFSSCVTNAFEEREALIGELYPQEQPFSNSQFIYVDGVRLHVRQWDSSLEGESKGVIFLIPGATASSYHWRYLVPVFRAYGWSVLCVDIPPFGFSGELQEDSPRFDSLGEDTRSRSQLFWSVFDTLYPSYSGTLILSGHSHGGRIASAMAIDRPQSVSQLLLFAPALGGVSTLPGIFKYEPFRTIAKKQALPMLDSFRIVNTFMEIVWDRTITEEEFNGNWAPFTREGAKRAVCEWLTSSVDAEPLDLSLITCPSLIFWAKHDKIVPNMGKKLEKSFSSMSYVPIKGSSHCLIETDTNTIIPHLIPVLSK